MTRTALILAGLVVLSAVSMAGVSGTVAASADDADDEFDDSHCGVSGPIVDEGTYSGSFDDPNDRASANLRLYEGQRITVTLDVVEETDAVELYAYEEPDRGGQSIETEIRGEANATVDRGFVQGLDSEQPAQFELWPQEDGYVCIELTAADESDGQWSVEIDRDGEDVELMDLRELENEVLSLENELRDAHNRTDELESEIEQLEEEHEQELADLEDQHEQELATVEEEHEEELAALEEEHEQELAELEEEHQQEIAALESDLVSLEAENQELRAEITALEETLDERNETIESQEATIEDQAETIESQEATIEEQESTIEEQNETISALQSENEELEETIDEHESDDGDEDGGGDGTPGFAIGVALIALLVVVGLLRTVR